MRFMSILSQLADKHRDIHLAITTYGCVDLTKFATNSNRPLNLQPLPPLLPATNDGLTMQQDLRCCVPLPMRICVWTCLTQTRQNRSMSRLPSSSSLLVTTHVVCKISFKQWNSLIRLHHHILVPTAVVRLGRRGVLIITSALHVWLMTNDIEANMKQVHSFDRKDLKGLNINMLAQNVAEVFKFPTDRDMAMETQTFLKATEYVVAQLVSFDATTPLQGHAFLPFPVLQFIAGDYQEQWVPKDVTRPSLPTKDACTYALARVARAVNAFSVPDVTPESHDVGRPLEVLAELAVLLFLLCNDKFTLCQVCSHTGSAGHGNIFDSRHSLSTPSTTSHLTSKPPTLIWNSGTPLIHYCRVPDDNSTVGGAKEP